jgi:hypothetical protein
MLAIAKLYRSHRKERFHLCHGLAYVESMALVTTPPRPPVAATRRGDGAQEPAVAPPAERIGDEARREAVRMELLLDRARRR